MAKMTSPAIPAAATRSNHASSDFVLNTECYETRADVSPSKSAARLSGMKSVRVGVPAPVKAALSMYL